MIEIDIALLRRLLTYDPETGCLIWRSRTPDMFADGTMTAEASCACWNGRLAGQEAFTATRANGYKVGALFNRTYRAHRVAFAIYHGHWPVAEIDHIDGNPANNRIANLRLANRSENLCNRGPNKTNITGVKGVSRRPDRSTYQARIKKNGAPSYLGTFASLDAAERAYKTAAARLHGVFARTTHHD